MSETTLNALINLFALFSSISNSKREDAVEIFSMYLQTHLGIAYSNEYMRLFEELLDFYGVGGESFFPIDKGEQAEKVSQNIKKILQRDEQIIVFLRFLELAEKGRANKAIELFDTLSRVFEIPEDEYRKFLQFFYHESPEELSSSDFILLSTEESGELLFLYSPLLDNFIFQYRGDAELTLGENPITSRGFYSFKEGGIIRGNRISPIYYFDLISRFGKGSVTKPFVFSADEIEFRFKNSDNGLYPFSFNEPSGQLIAIMGGSGVGKSTLINILNGNIVPHKGSIKINESDIHKEREKIEGLIGYVPQDDLLFEELTVWENLYYNASLCFDTLTNDRIREKVDNMLNELELSPFKDLKVGSPLKKTISGGQRKRLNIAMELIREPAILFVDEPTSGLSSTDSEMVMLLMKGQARKGKLLFVNIHQPSSSIYRLFDKLWVMDKGGRVIYNGHPLEAVVYFKRAANYVNSDISECINCGNINPEQVLDIIETKQIDSSGNFTSERRYTPDYWYSLFRDLSSSYKKEYEIRSGDIPDNETRKPSRLKQFLIFFRRNLRTKLADKQYILINLLEAPLLALIISYFTRFSETDQYIFMENKNLLSYIFMAIIVVVFIGMSVSAEEIIKDRKILQREKFLNLSRTSYLNSKILFLLLLSAFQAFALVVIGNLIIGIHHLTFAYWIVLFSVAFFSNLLGLNISSAFDSVVTIYILIPLLLIPQILLCGIIVRFDDLQSRNATRDAVPVYGDLMVSRWAFEALAVEQYRNNPYMIHFFDIDKEIANNRYTGELLIPLLINELDQVAIDISRNGDSEKIDRDLRIIRNEILKLGQADPANIFANAGLIRRDSFDDRLRFEAKEYLNSQKDIYQRAYQPLNRTRDGIIERISREHGSDYLFDLKKRYHNTSLETFVLNTDSQVYYKKRADGIMRKIAPIYKLPDFNNGRAHFPSSEKIVLGHHIDTFAFNLAAIWLMSLILYLALLFDWLRKIINIFANNK